MEVRSISFPHIPLPQFDTTMYKSLYNEQKLPSDLSLPQFVFRYLEKERNEVPVLHPSPFGSRSQCKALTLLDVRDGAYAIAKSLLSSEYPGGPWKKGEVVLFLTENQVRQRPKKFNAA